MWRQAKLAFTENVGALSCSIVPAHPWIYGLGQLTDSGAYLSPANALGYLAQKLASSDDAGDVVVIMVTENNHDSFMQGLDSLARVFPAPAFTHVRRMAKAAAELSTVKMQLPARAAHALPAATSLSVSTNRTAINAQRIAAAQLAAAVSPGTEGLQQQLAGFIQTRADLLSSVSQGLDELKTHSAKIWSFVHNGNHRTGAVELLKGVPQLTAVHTAAMMFVADSLKDLEGMLHEPDRTTRP